MILIDEKYHKINSFIYNDILLIFDIFIVNNELVLICPLYTESYLEDISVILDCEELSDKTIMKFYDGPIMVLKYKIKHNNEKYSTNTIIYKDKIQTVDLYRLLSDKKNFMMTTTMYLNDHRYIKRYKDYYEKQGCDNFILYFNGILNEELKKEYISDNTLLIDWNFKYFVEQSFFINLNLGHKYPINNAQLGQINHALYKYGKPLFHWFISCDLDEYLYIKDTTLKNFLSATKEKCIKFENYWSEIVELEKTINSIYNVDIRKNIKSSGHVARTKLIINPVETDALGVHHAQKLYKNDKKIEEYTPEQSYMIHMCNYTRARNLVDTNNCKIIKLNPYE